jgi:hypothetical protein
MRGPPVCPLNESHGLGLLLLHNTQSPPSIHHPTIRIAVARVPPLRGHSYEVDDAYDLCRLPYPPPIPAALAVAATQAAGEAAAGGAAVEGSAGAAVEGGTKTEAVASGTHAGCSKEAVATEAAADSSSSGTQWGLPARGFGPGKGKEFLLRHRACSAADDKVGRRWEGRGARCLLRVALARHGDTLVAFSG